MRRCWSIINHTCNQSEQLEASAMDSVQQPGVGQDDQSSAATVSDSRDVQTLGDEDLETDEETAKRRKKDRKNLQQNAPTGRRKARRLEGRTMAEWKVMCNHMKLPTESQQFCDFVLVFDEIDKDDITEARNRTGCCKCLHKSPKELEKCDKVCHRVFIDLDQ